MARAPKYAWESALYDNTEWERELQQLDSVPDSDNEDDRPWHERCTAEEAGDELNHFLIQLKHQGLLSAKQACMLAWWAQRAGAQGDLFISYPPGRQSGQYSPHFDAALRKRLSSDDSGGFYTVTAPVCRRSDGSRVKQGILVYPPHEILLAEAERETARDELATALANGELPPDYFEHPAYVDAQSTDADVPVYPLALYVDGVAFTRTDKIIGIWVENLATRLRSLCVALRHSTLCKCGCRGNCTLYVIMEFLRWSIESMAKGTMPSCRHDNSEWLASDSARAAKAGQQLTHRGCVLLLKCDMMEFVTTFGLPSWKTHRSPCPQCWCTVENMGHLAGLSALGLPWEEKSLADYEQACRDCEIWVHIPVHLFKKIAVSWSTTNPVMGYAGGACVSPCPS